MNLLLTAIGKRIQLIRHLQEQFRVIGTDCSEENAARHFVDVFALVPRCSDPGYADALLEICRKEKVSVIVPLYEPEFPVLNAAREKFAAAGVQLLLSDQRVIDICDDKRKTAVFFEKHNIPAPHTFSGISAVESADLPVIIKPLDGMGSAGVFRADTMEQARFFADYVKKPVIQTCASGAEYTIDVLCDLQGEPVYVIPRLRVEVRSGEVVKSRTVKNELLVNQTIHLLRALSKEGSVMGPLTVQAFLDASQPGTSVFAGPSDSRISFIEINARFGGGVPLSFEAGADYASAMKEMLKGGKVQPQLNHYRELLMMRYDQAVYEEGRI